MDLAAKDWSAYSEAIPTRREITKRQENKVLADVNTVIFYTVVHFSQLCDVQKVNLSFHLDRCKEEMKNEIIDMFWTNLYGAAAMNNISNNDNFADYSNNVKDRNPSPGDDWRKDRISYSGVSSWNMKYSKREAW